MKTIFQIFLNIFLLGYFKQQAQTVEGDTHVLIFSPGGKDFYRNYVLNYRTVLIKGAGKHWPLFKYLNGDESHSHEDFFVITGENENVTLYNAFKNELLVNRYVAHDSNILNLVQLPFSLSCNEYLENLKVSLHLHSNQRDKEVNDCDKIIVPLDDSINVVICPLHQPCHSTEVQRGDQIYIPMKTVYAIHSQLNSKVNFVAIEFSIFEHKFVEGKTVEETQSLYKTFLEKQPRSILCNNTKISIKDALTIDFNDESKILHLRIPKLHKRPDDIVLASGYKMPVLGLGTALLNETTYDAVKYALSVGYRLFDLAYGYPFSETGFAKALHDSNVSRADVFVVTKLHPKFLGYNETLHAIDLSLENLKTKYIDLYLIHSVECDDFLLACEEGEPKGTWKQSWRAMEEAVNEGKIRSIGVSNFYKERLMELINWSYEPISVVQNWFDPFNQDRETRKICNKYNIRFMGFSTLGSRWKLLGMSFNPVMTSEVLSAISGHHDYIVSHIVLRWAIHKNVTVIPRSGNPNHIAQNIRSLDIKLHVSDIEDIDNLNAFGSDDGDDDDDDDNDNDDNE